MQTLVFDTETTGLLLPSVADLDKQPHIIELALARVVDGKVVSTHEWIINPEVELPAIITKITGIKPEDLVGKPVFADAWPEIRKCFEGVDQVIAHNLPFDSGMLNNELRRLECTDFKWPEIMTCTVQETYHELGRRQKMTELYKRTTGKELEQKHRALDDVMALVEIAIAKGLA